MRRFFLGTATALFLSLATPAHAEKHYWRITSPDHGQTYSYGMEQNRVWTQWGQHLALLLTYTNDPFVDRSNPRMTDNLTFHFRNIVLGRHGSTFYYTTRTGRKIPVAQKKADFFGINEVHLLPEAVVLVEKLHGYVSAVIILEDRLHNDESLQESL